VSSQQFENRREPEPPEDEAPPAPPAPAAGSDTEVDSLLAEIDDVLETNAETFVRGFVQKGGQ